MKFIAVIFVSALLTGCSTAGPFVTSISSDGNGNLLVEKCMLHYNPLGWVDNSDCNNVNIRMGERK